MPQVKQRRKDAGRSFDNTGLSSAVPWTLYPNYATTDTKLS